MSGKIIFTNDSNDSNLSVGSGVGTYRERPKRHIETGCCVTFEKAQEEGTDNEGYAPLLMKENEKWRIGCDLGLINNCPWCGTFLKK